MIDRRTFGQLIGAGALGLATARMGQAQSKAKKKIAFLGTVVFKHSHAQHFLDRLCEGYIWNGNWQEPRLEVAALISRNSLKAPTWVASAWLATTSNLLNRSLTHCAWEATNWRSMAW